MKYKELTKEIIECAMKVHSTLGNFSGSNISAMPCNRTQKNQKRTQNKKAVIK